MSHPIGILGRIEERLLAHRRTVEWQDLHHRFRPDQLTDEIDQLLALCQDMDQALENLMRRQNELEYQASLSTRELGIGCPEARRSKDQGPRKSQRKSNEH